MSPIMIFDWNFRDYTKEQRIQRYRELSQIITQPNVPPKAIEEHRILKIYIVARDFLGNVAAFESAVAAEPAVQV